MASVPEMLGLNRPSGCVVIAEVAQAHDGSLGIAHAHIDAASKAGADFIKFQTHIAEAESTPAEPWRVKFSLEDDTRYEYWQRMEFTESQWHGLKDHADEVGLGFLSTPFSSEAVNLLSRVGVAGWKVASGEVTNLPLIKQMAETGRPVLLSSGMSRIEELDAAVAVITDAGAQVAIFQCTTQYPTPADAVGLNVLGELRDRYNVPVGLSDHSATIFAGIAAVTLGAELLEVHLTLSEHMFGPDVPASLTVNQLAQLVDGVRFVDEALSHPIDKDEVAESMGELRATFQKSYVASREIQVGETIDLDLVELKKPGGGMTTDDIDLILGKQASRTIGKDSQLSLSDVRGQRG